MVKTENLQLSFTRFTWFPKQNIFLSFPGTQIDQVLPVISMLPALHTLNPLQRLPIVQRKKESMNNFENTQQEDIKTSMLRLLPAPCLPPTTSLSYTLCAETP
jgi:hypothetical protein